ncbi:MAG TPA: UPF0149 family protein [Hyphomonas sp.]|nr:UPF0149 family protein [Hyphomonas sp.]
MRKLTEDGLARLDHFLACQEDDEVMMVPELDGFLTGLLVCPEMILPSEWLPVVWGGDGPVFEDQTEANEILGLIMAFYNDIASRLKRPSHYRLHLDLDTDGSEIWELWASGFGKALDLRPEAWRPLHDAPDDDPHAMAFNVLNALAYAADQPGGGYLPNEIEKELRLGASEMLAACVIDLHNARLAREKLSRTPKAGRNDPCPCGSGKKYKKCCLQAEKA